MSPGPSILLTRSKKEPTHLRPNLMRFFLTRGEKIEKFVIFRGKFLNPNTNQRWLTRHDQGQKKFNPEPSLELTNVILIIETF